MQIFGKCISYAFKTFFENRKHIKISEITRNHWHFTKLWEKFGQHSDVGSKNVFSIISQDTFIKKFESQTPDETNTNAIAQCSRLLFDVQPKFFSFPLSISSNFWSVHTTAYIRNKYKKDVSKLCVKAGFNVLNSHAFCYIL